MEYIVAVGTKVRSDFTASFLLFLIIYKFLLTYLVIFNVHLTLKVFMTSSGYFRALRDEVLVDNIPFIEFKYDMFI